MTKDDFYKIAAEKQKINAESIYQLTIRFYWDEIKGYRKSSNKDEWYYKLLKTDGFYTTKEKAEEALKLYIESDDRIHSALINRLAANLPIGSSNILEWWLYDGLGTEVDSSVCTFLLKEPMSRTEVYWGREPRQIRFQKGEIVEVIKNDRVYAEVISALPSSIDEMWNRYKDLLNDDRKADDVKFKSEYFENCFSDSYYYLQSDGYECDVPPCLVMKPTFTVPQKVKEVLTIRYNRWKNK